MSTRERPEIDPDDMFSDTRMTFGEHIEDLRTHLMRALKGFLVALVAGFVLSPWVVKLITVPVEEAVTAFYERRIERARERLRDDPKMFGLGQAVEVQKVPLKPLVDALSPFFASREPLPNIPEDAVVELPIPRNPAEELFQHKLLELKIFYKTLSTLSPQEAVMVYIKVALLTGLVIASPWVFWQIWSFIAAGLYPHEKKLVHAYLPFSLGLFLGGIIFCQFWVMPAAVKALLWFNEWLDVSPDLRLNEWLGFAIMLPLVFGISFQTPVVMFFLHRVGLIDTQSYREKRRLAWFLLAVFAAVMTPTPDPVNMCLLWLPMGLLYELGIWLCAKWPRTVWDDLGVGEPEETVEV